MDKARNRGIGLSHAAGLTRCVYTSLLNSAGTCPCAEDRHGLSHYMARSVLITPQSRGDQHTPHSLGGSWGQEPSCPGSLQGPGSVGCVTELTKPTQPQCQLRDLTHLIWGC